jgi:hypothetical protein
MDIVELLLNGGTPEQKMLAQAEAIRSRKAMEGALQENQRDASKYDLLNFAAQAAGNNPGLAAGVGALQKSAQARSRVQPLGAASVLVGDRVLDNPGYGEQKESDRMARVLQAAGMIQQRRESAEMRRQQAAEAEAGRNERAEQWRALRMTLGGMANANRATANEEKKAAARDKFIETNVQRYSQFLTKEGVPEFMDALDTVDTVLGQYKDDIPGYGRMESLIPSAVASDEVQMVRSNMQAAANILLKARSGAAVTEPEQRRFLTEVAGGKAMSEKALRNGWSNVRKHFEAKAAGMAAGYADDIHEEYVTRGGRDFRKGKPQKPGAAPAAPQLTGDPLIDKYLK